MDASEYTWEPTTNLECANAEAKCNGYAQGDAVAKAVSDIASNTTGLVEGFCKVPLGHDGKLEIGPVLAEADGLAEAFAKVWAAAGAWCSISDNKDADGNACLDPYYDGGCAYSKAWVEAFSEACAEAVSSASAKITFGSKTDDCDCNLGGEAFATAVAHEVETIHAKAVLTVEAEACTDGVLDSEIARTCLAKSVAELYAKVRPPRVPRAERPGCAFGVGRSLVDGCTASAPEHWRSVRFSTELPVAITAWAALCHPDSCTEFCKVCATMTCVHTLQL